MSYQEILDAQLKLAIQRLYNIYSTMTSNHKECKAGIKYWLIMEHLAFNGCSPLEFIQKGQGQKVLNYIDNWIVKSQTP